MPQPLDAPSEVARTTLADRVQHVNDRAVLAHQMQAADNEAEIRAAAETQVSETHETENERVDPEGKRRNPFVGRRRRRPKKKDDSQADRASRTFYTADVRKEVAGEGEAGEFDVTI